MYNFTVVHCEALSREPSGAQNSRSQGEYFTYWETKVFLSLICYMINVEPTIFLDDDIVFELGQGVCTLFLEHVFHCST
jgi:hypothetical protein